MRGTKRIARGAIVRIEERSSGDIGPYTRVSTARRYWGDDPRVTHFDGSVPVGPRHGCPVINPCKRLARADRSASSSIQAPEASRRSAFQTNWARRVKKYSRAVRVLFSALLGKLLSGVQLGLGVLRFAAARCPSGDNGEMSGIKSTWPRIRDAQQGFARHRLIRLFLL